jgi:hypothetical protein
MAERKRKPPSAKAKLEVLQRDNYSCVICGRSPVTVPGLTLEVDHVEPFSKGGADALANYQTLCRRCNRGKGSNAELNKTLAADIAILLDDIDPKIRVAVASGHITRVVANHEDFVRLVRANESHDPPLYIIRPTTDVAIGAGALGSAGIRTVRDSGGVKAIFDIGATQ